MSTPLACVSFEVLPGTYRIVSACGMEATDALELWRQACPNVNCPDDGTDCWIQFRPDGHVVTLTELANPLIVETPGKYRMAFSGVTNTSVTVCVDDPYQVTPTSTSRGA
jgi:hypothetical protein